MTHLKYKFHGISNSRQIEFDQTNNDIIQYINKFITGQIRNNKNNKTCNEFIYLVQILYPNFKLNYEINYDNQISINCETFICYAVSQILSNHQLDYFNHRDIYLDLKNNIQVSLISNINLIF